jgi:hypothetical protein
MHHNGTLTFMMDVREIQGGRQVLSSDPIEVNYPIIRLSENDLILRRSDGEEIEYQRATDATDSKFPWAPQH